MSYLASSETSSFHHAIAFSLGEFRHAAGINRGKFIVGQCPIFIGISPFPFIPIYFCLIERIFIIRMIPYSHINSKRSTPCMKKAAQCHGCSNG